MAKIIETPFISSCDCCGRTIYELEPFSKLGNSKVTKECGDAVLVKSMRPLVAPDKEVDRISKKFFGKRRTSADLKKAHAKLVQKYGHERAKDIEFISQAMNSFSNALQCKDCAILSHEEYHEKLQAREAMEKEQGTRRAFLVILNPDEWKVSLKSPKKDCSDFVPF